MKIFKHLFFFSVFILSFAVSTKAQYANAWINYSQQHYKIKVAQDGMYRVDYNALVGAGIPVGSIQGNTFQLFSRGASVPLYVSTSGTFSSTDYIQFYGLKNDGSTEKVIYNDPNHQANDKLSLFNDTSAYFLTWSTNPNPDIIVDQPNVITSGVAAEPFCWYTSTLVYGGARGANNLIRGQPEIQGQQVWDSDFSNAEGYIDNTFNHTSITKQVPTPNPYYAGPAATLKAQWCGKFPTDHYMEVSINGTLLDIQSYFGFQTRRVDTLLPTNSLLGSTTTGVTFSSVNNPVTAVDHNGISYVEITYPREFNFNAQSIVPFKLPSASGQRYIAVTNFNTSGGQAILYDLTNKLRLVAIAGGNDTLKFMLPSASGERDLVMFAEPNVVNAIAQLQQRSFTNFNLPANQGNFIIVANKFFRNDGSGNDYVNEYKQLKNSHGFQSVIVDMDELYDQFGYGIDLSPLCFRNFTDYALATWTTVPGEKNMLLVGKAIEWHPFNLDPANLKPLCYVPTWGYPGSDVLLTAQPNNPVPRIHVGRLSILEYDDLKNYKDKVEQYVAAQNMPQTIADKAWMKRVVHLAGGESETDQFVFQYILNTYASLIEDSVYFGGDATMFSKNSSDPISMATSAAMDSLISAGVSLITFFGHSSYQSLDFNLNDPYNYHNDGKYPLIVTNGCLVGNLFALDEGLGGKFTFAQSRGSIGFLAPSNFSVSNSLQLYTDAFYRHLTKEHYNATIGELVSYSVSDAVNFSGSNVDRMVAEQMLYQGDPSLRLNTFAAPDYALEAQSIYFNPSVVSAGVDSFSINVVVTNIGKAIDDSIYLDITRVWPNGDQTQVVHQKIKAPFYIDTFTYKMPNPALVGLGLNQFMIKIDANNDVDELSEMNNQIGANIIVQSDDIIPIYPYDFSIVNQQSVQLKASSVNPFVQQGHFIFQIDTTENFNSPLLHTTNITQSGGVVAWQPSIALVDSTVYYWRTSVDTIGGKEISWHNASFVYLAGSSTGWNQSHYFQFKNDKYVNVELNADRTFSFVDDVKNIAVYNGIASDYGGPLNWDEIGLFINGTKVAKWTCGYGVNWLFAVIDSATGINWESIPQGNGFGQFNNIHCNNLANYNAFYFNSTDPANQQAIIDFIDTIPNGDYVLAMSINDPGFAGLTPALEAAFATIGAQALDTITMLKPYVLFAKKGDASYPVYEVVGDTFTSILDTSFNIVGSWETGYIESTQIGPAQQWQSVHKKLSDVELLDEVRMQIIGVKQDGSQEVVVQNVIANDSSINGINALVYPYLKLRIDYTDTLNRTPPQLDYWRINYAPEGELAIDPHSLYTITDTVNKFSSLLLHYAVANVSPVPMFNVPVKYVITDVANAQYVLTSTLDTVSAFDTVVANLSYLVNSSSFAGLNKILIEVNPFGATHVNEQQHFNNIATATFIGTQDNVNPFMDVTFDGIHIMNRDIVSAKPEISIRLKDDNQTLKLTDTAAFDIQLRWPDGTLHQVVFDGVTAIFTAATGNVNSASALFKPELTQDGTYQLIVQGFDRSGNPAGQYAYRVDFDVINKPMISNVLNYPNPFTTQTRFVFTLTGSRIPEYFKIQIMTVSGKIVKEIHKEELGQLHVGHNMTDYAWDGRDQFGDALANGLYLYRVVTRLDNNPIERYETSVDKMFEKGFGKMYLMR